MKYRFTLLCSALLAISATTTFGQLRKINTIAGLGNPGFSGDGGVATNAELHGPSSISVDGNGNIFFVDYFNVRVRKINTAGIISTIAGNGLGGYGGDGSIGTSAQINPNSVAVSKKGDVYISDAVNGVIRVVNGLGIINTFAGTGIGGNTGNGGPALNARMDQPRGIAFDTKGNLFVADAANHVVRKIDTFGIITRFAGNDTAGFMGDGGPATAARLDSPYAVAIDKKGNVFIADYKNNLIRKVDTAGIISTFAGNTFMDYTGDNGPAGLASFRKPVDLAVDAIGNLYIADVGNHVIRMIDTFKIITTVAGNGTFGFSGDLGPSIGANLYAPNGVTVDKYGNIYIGDANNHRLRKVYATTSVANTSNSSVKAYPNPAGDMITIEGVSNTDRMIVYDITGRPVMATANVAGESTQTIDLSRLSNGMYTIGIFSSEGTVNAHIEIVKR